MSVELRHYRKGDLPAVRAVLLDVYAEVYAADAEAGVRRYAERLAEQSAHPAWEAVVGYEDGEPVGFAQGCPVPAGGDDHWFTVRPRPDAEFCRETGFRTFVLFDLMVRERWRKTDTAWRIHDNLMASRLEERMSFLVDPDQQGVQRLSEDWGYQCIGVKKPWPDGSDHAVMIRDLRQP
ncbi:hypothetical protein ACZ90_31480 [Streptomyces albus subsp. albus]|nr:hypothetical protein ACZ90_31480 [Streptomyces albus subsp. albus]